MDKARKRTFRTRTKSQIKYGIFSIFAALLVMGVVAPITVSAQVLPNELSSISDDEAQASNYPYGNRYRRIDRRMKEYNRVSLGEGFIETLYRMNRRGSLKSLAIRVDGAAMRSLPTELPHDGATCFDTDGDGIDLLNDCRSGHERVLWFPQVGGSPFKWLMFNWQPVGHGPPHVFEDPHFDLHLFIQNLPSRNTIRTGPCRVVINCDDDVTAKKIVADGYIPEGWGLPGAAGRMGNHLIDPNAAPANGGPFDQAFAFGTWDGHVSFWEPVINVDWVKQLDANETECRPIPQPPEVELSGTYPSRMCTQHQWDGTVVTVLDKFYWRAAPAGAEPPDWMFD